MIRISIQDYSFMIGYLEPEEIDAVKNVTSFDAGFAIIDNAELSLSDMIYGATDMHGFGKNYEPNAVCIELERIADYIQDNFDD